MDAITSTEQTLDPKDKALVDLVYERLQRWGDSLQPYYDRARAARKVALLDDPEQDSEAENGGKRPRNKTLQLQTLKSTLNNCIADQMDNMPEALIAPERPGLENVAMDVGDVVRFILSRNKYEEIHRRRVEDFFVAGTAVTQVAWDETMDDGQGNVAIIRWPIEAMVWDPYAADIQDARALMKISWHPHEWYEEHYPDKAQYVGDDDYAHNQIGKPEVQQELTYDTEHQSMMIEYWWREFNASTKRYKINVAYVAGGALLERAENVYWHGRYPFRFDAFTSVEGSPAGIGMVEELTPMMRYINRYARYIDENLRMSAKMRMLVRKDSGIDTKALADWESNIITGDAIDPSSIQWLQSKPLSGMAVQQMLQFQTDLKQDSGQNQFTRGETAGGVTAAQAISALQEAGGKITRYHTTVLNRGFAEIAEQIVWLIAQFYTDKKEQLITGSDGKAHEVIMGADHLMGNDASALLPPQDELDALPPELADRIVRTARRKASKRKREMVAPPYTVSVQVQRRNPLRVQAQNELFIQAYTMAAQAGQQFPLSLLFDLLVVDGKERILPVLQQVDQQTQQLQQAMQQIESLQGENEQLSKALETYGQALRQGSGAAEPLATEEVDTIAGTPEDRPF